MFATVKRGMLAMALAILAGSPALAENHQVRDCRPSSGVTIPVVPSGHDLIVAHATDDLAGPSIFQRFAKTEAGDAIDITLKRFDSYEAQIAAYLSCDTPFLRTTPAMLSFLADQIQSDTRTRAIPVFMYGWSNGADVLVGRGANTSSISGLAGSKIITDAARLDLALQLASEVSPAPEIAVSSTPAEDFANETGKVFAIVGQDKANILTDGDVGTGAEGSIKGARAYFSTKSASRVNPDILVVRSDYFSSNEDVTRGLIRALLKAEELFREDAKKQIVDYEIAAETILGDEALHARLKTMWSGVETVGLAGQTIWADETHPLSFRSLMNQGQNRMVNMGIIDQAILFESPSIDFASLGDDIWDKRRVSSTAFDKDAATAAVQAMSNNDMEGNTIASVTIYFEPKQKAFKVDDYRDQFEAALEKGLVYAGAVLSVEGHSAYSGYVKGVKKKNWPVARQKMEFNSLQTLSTQRAIEVRQALIDAATQLNIPFDDSQIVINGRGIEDPLGGFCGGIPCYPKTEEEWRKSRRVVFRVIAMESEEDVFTPMNDW